MTIAVPVLSGIDLSQLVGALSGSDSMELKATVPDDAARSAVTALGMDALDAQIRQVFFFETPDLALQEAGVVVRGRRVKGRGDDSVVKLRPVTPDLLPEALRALPDFVVEVDAMRGGFVCSASYKQRLAKPFVRRVALGEAPVRKLFSKGQRAFFAEHAPAGVGLDDLVVMGPVFVLKLPFVAPEYARKVVAEMWLYPDGTTVAGVVDEVRAVRGVRRDGPDDRVPRRTRHRPRRDPQTKTKTALQFFANSLRRESGSDRDRAPVGMAHVRSSDSKRADDLLDTLRRPISFKRATRCTRPYRTATSSAVGARRCFDQAPRRRDGRQASRARRRPWASSSGSPVMKSAFPLVRDRRRLLVAERARGTRRALSNERTYTLAELRTRPHRSQSGSARPTRVHKRRAHYTIDDCMVERTDMTTGHNARCRTIAIESPDPALVVATRRRLGFDRRRNVNVERDSSRSSGSVHERYAVIDVGTNSVKFHIGARQADGTWQHDRRPRRRHPPRRRSRRVRPPYRASDRSDRRRDRRDGRRRTTPEDVIAIAAVGTAGLRLAPNRADIHRRGAGPLRNHDRGHLRRGGRSTRVPRRDTSAPHRPRSARRLRLRRRQLTVHLRSRRARRRTIQRQRRRGAVRRTVRPHRDRLRSHARHCARRDRLPTSTDSTGGRNPTP